MIAYLVIATIHPRVGASEAPVVGARAPAGTVRVVPVEVDGELPDKWRAQATASIRAALERAELRASDDMPESGHAAWVVRPRLRVDATSRDYALRIDVDSTRTGATVATIEGTCSLCGFEEVVAMIEAKAAAAAASITRLESATTLLELRSTPAGAAVEIDGRALGTTPTTVEIEPGPHRVRASKPGHVTQVVEVEAIEGARKSIELALAIAPAPVDATRARRQARAITIAGAVLLGTGVAAIATGGALVGIDGHPRRRDCQADVRGNCRFLYGTLPAGIATLAGGAAVAIGGAVATGIGVRRARRARGELGRGAPPRWGLVLGPRSLGVRVRW